MKVNIFNLQGKPSGSIELPEVFEESFRPDVIRRAFLALQSLKRQPYGSDKRAGLKTSAHYHGKRRQRWTMMMRDMARLPRLHATSPHLTWRARITPETVKGRRAHPPKPEKKWAQKINKKELELAIRSAIAATGDKEVVKKRGHRVDDVKEFPLIVNEKIESLNKTKDVENLLTSLGLEEELERSKIKKIRSGKARMRGRKYKRKVGPLIVVEEDKGIVKAGRNLPGVDIRDMRTLSIEDLAPGSDPGRLTVWSKSVIERMSG